MSAIASHSASKLHTVESTDAISRPRTWLICRTQLAVFGCIFVVGIFSFLKPQPLDELVATQQKKANQPTGRVVSKGILSRRVAGRGYFHRCSPPWWNTNLQVEHLGVQSCWLMKEWWLSKQASLRWANDCVGKMHTVS